MYQSCTQQNPPTGSMEGSFTFVEGTSRQPTGPTFDAEVKCLLPGCIDDCTALTGIVFFNDAMYHLLHLLFYVQVVHA